MGQQQLLLLVLGIVIVGLAVVVGIQAFGENQKKSNQDAMVNDGIRIASDAQAWALKPAAFGGGEGDFTVHASTRLRDSRLREESQRQRTRTSTAVTPHAWYRRNRRKRSSQRARTTTPALRSRTLRSVVSTPGHQDDCRRYRSDLPKSDRALTSAPRHCRLWRPVCSGRRGASRCGTVAQCRL